jgi:hypothetical protein
VLPLLTDNSRSIDLSGFSKEQIELQTHLDLDHLLRQLAVYDLELLLTIGVVAPLINLIIHGYRKGTGATGSNQFDLLFSHKEGNYLWFKDTSVRLLLVFCSFKLRLGHHTVDLAMHVEAPSIEVGATVALMWTETAIVSHWIVTVAP